MITVLFVHFTQLDDSQKEEKKLVLGMFSHTLIERWEE